MRWPGCDFQPIKTATGCKQSKHVCYVPVNCDWLYRKLFCIYFSTTKDNNSTLPWLQIQNLMVRKQEHEDSNIVVVTKPARIQLENNYHMQILETKTNAICISNCRHHSSLNKHVSDCDLIFSPKESPKIINSVLYCSFYTSFCI